MRATGLIVMAVDVALGGLCEPQRVGPPEPMMAWSFLPVCISPTILRA